MMPVYTDAPRKRLEEELKTGNLHVHMISNPLWWANKSEFFWSEPVFEEKNIFVVKKDEGIKLASLDDLKGKKVGTQLGYVYPNLAKGFESGQVIREDVKEPPQNVTKLLAGRIDAYIASDIVFKYFQKTNAEGKQLTIADHVLSAHQIHWAISKKAPFTAEKVNEVLAKLKASGKINEILARYN